MKLSDQIREVIFKQGNAEAFNNPPLWISYFDAGWNQIGLRQSALGTQIDSKNKVSLPPVLNDKAGITRIALYDAESGGNFLMAWWDLQLDLKAGERAVDLDSPVS